MTSVEEMETVVQNLLAEVNNSNLSFWNMRDLLTRLKRFKRTRTLLAERNNHPSNGTATHILIVMLAVSLIAPHSEFIWQSTTRWLGRWINRGGNYPQCIIDMPIDSRTFFRPPVDCAICRDVTEVDVVDHITPENFSAIYAYSGRPVLIKDALVNWEAMEAFSFSFFEQLYAEHGGGFRSARCQFFPYKTEFRSLREALSMSEDRKQKPWYFGWSNCDSVAADILRRYYSRPYFLPLFSESSRTDWIFMGTAGLGAHMHVDHVGLPSWQAQIRGKKLWILEPPPECFYQCKSMEIVVQPGDTIVLDTNKWYHKTSVLSEETSITIGSEYD